MKHLLLLSTFIAYSSLLYTAPNDYIPIVLIPGISSAASAAYPFAEQLRYAFPGIYVKIVMSLDEGLHTGWDRIEHAKQQINADSFIQQCGQYDMICHSQGTLDGRGVIETHAANDTHARVHHYIGMSGPQAGEFGIPSTIREQLEKLIHNQKIGNYIAALLKADKRYIFPLFYSPLLQDNVSFAGYWKDPLHMEPYLTRSKFLPYLNNEIPHENAMRYKENLMQLAALVLIASTHETEIVPRLSAHFGFFKTGSDSIIETFEQRYNSTNDSLGLYALSVQQKLHLLEAQCTHTKFWTDEAVFAMVKPYVGSKQSAPYSLPLCSTI